jgi:hypothetical protein
MRTEFSTGIFKNFVQQFFFFNFPDLNKQWCEMKTNEDQHSLVIHCNVKAKIPIMKLLEESVVPFVFTLFIKIIDDYGNYILFQMKTYIKWKV